MPRQVPFQPIPHPIWPEAQDVFDQQGNELLAQSLKSASGFPSRFKNSTYFSSTGKTSAKRDRSPVTSGKTCQGRSLIVGFSGNGMAAF
jgi:hypothetical protein